MKHLVNVLKGAVIGIANAVPGVSGGTMMVIMKVFDKILGSFSIKKIKENFWFLATIFIGMGLGIIFASKVLSICFDKFFVQTQFFFLGVIIGSLPMIYKEATSENKFKLKHILPFIIGLIVIIAIAIFSSKIGDSSIRTSLTPTSFVYLVIVSIVAAAAMIMPGLSGSLIFLILGAYQTIIQAVDELNIPLLIPVGIGVIIGVVLCAKLITLCLKKWRNGTYATILGLIFGSLYSVFPRESIEVVDGIEKTVGANFAFNTSGIIAILFGLIGIALPLAMMIIDNKKTTKN